MIINYYAIMFKLLLIQYLHLAILGGGYGIVIMTKRYLQAYLI